MNRNNQRNFTVNSISHKIGYSRGKLFGLLIIAALFAFELFNYSTTEFALNDLLGGLRFATVRWATILAIAFCGIDFAGIARLFTPQQSSNDIKEVWYLFGAWLLAASMNAMLTWWGVSLAIVNHQSLGGTVIDRQTILDIVPIFVAVMVWLIRVLIIGTFSVAGDRLFSQENTSAYKIPTHAVSQPENGTRTPQPQPVAFHPLSKISPQANRQTVNRPEPTYHPASMSGYEAGTPKHH